METGTAPRKSWAKKLECPVDENADYENTYWCNRDLIPFPLERRTWTWQGYAGYWVIAGINTTPWTVGASMLTLGLSVGQAMGIVFTATLIIAALAVGAGWPGSHQYLGFTVTSRSSWGMRGAFWPVLNRVMTGIVWMGIQMYWGGQAVQIVLGGLIGPKFIFMPNTIPASANVTTAEIVSFLIFTLILLPILYIRPEKLQMPFRIAFVMISAVLLGMLIWSCSTAGGTGDLVKSGPSLTGSTLSWNTVYALQSFLGAYGGGVLGQSDWTRYAKTPNAALFGQAVAAPITICVTAIFGILIASASQQIYGQPFWSPFQLLLFVQQELTPASRAGTFFAGLGLLASQLALCIVLNSVPSGMDLTTLLPKYINLRRGSYIVTVLAIAICPWNYVKEPVTFILVLSGWSVFLAPMTGVLIADYFIVRRRQLHLADLYVGNDTSAYWFLFGFNPRAFFSWAMGLWPLLPGFIRSVRGENLLNSSGWDNVYYLNYFIGFGFAFITHLALSFAFPPKIRAGSSPFEMREKGILADGEIGPREIGGDSASSNGSVRKEAVVGGGKTEVV